MKRIIAYSSGLENADIENDVPAESDGELVETSLDAINTVDQLNADTGRQVAALEELASLYSDTKVLLNTSQTSFATLGMLRSRADRLPIGAGTAIESIDDLIDVPDLGELPYEKNDPLAEDQEIIQHHEVAAENFRDGWDRMAQRIVLDTKHKWDVLTDLFKNSNARLEKYSKRLSALEDEYHEKKDNLDTAGSQLGLDELWYFFSNDQGQVRQMAKALEADVKVSRFALVEYPERVLAAVGKLTSIIGSVGSIQDEEDVMRLVSKLKDLENPAYLFDRSLIGGRPNLDVMGFTVVTAKSMQRVKINGEYDEDLTDVARTRSVAEDWSFKHAAKKVLSNGGGTVGKAIDNATNRTASYTVEDIGKMIICGKGYISNIEKYQSMMQDAQRVFGRLDNAIQKMIDGCGYEDRDATTIFTVLMRMSSNYQTCFTSPATQEMARSAKAVKYIDYTGKRMIYNARK